MSSEPNGPSRAFAVAVVVLVVFAVSPAAGISNSKGYGNCTVYDDIDEITDAKEVMLSCWTKPNIGRITVHSPSQGLGWWVHFKPIV